MSDRRGLVMVLTGDGKGKTTSAFGQALRAVGRGMRVAVVQFIKGRHDCGEVLAAARLAPDLEVHVCGAGFVLDPNHPREEDRRGAQEALDLARRLMQDPALDMLILDEINVAADLGLVDATTLLNLIDGKPPQLHLVLTGRRASAQVIERADLVTEMRNVKHPFDRGVRAQPGIEE